MIIFSLPTGISILFHLPRTMRDMNKAILGMNTGLAITVILLHPELWVKIIVIIVMVPSAWYVEKHRSKRNNKICMNCLELKERSSYKCSGLQLVGNRLQLIHLIAQSQLPDPFQNTRQKVKKFDDL